MPRQSNKKKVKRRDRNQKSTSCYGCSKHVHKNALVYCSCTQVIFCSSSCQQDHPHIDCPGPPEAEFDLGEKLRLMPEGERRSSDVARRQNLENDETVRNPSVAYMLSKGIHNLMHPNDISVWEYAKWADEGDELGNQACAYLAGSRFRHRLLSGGGDGLVGSNRRRDDIPVLESQELAFKYFEKAAKLGHGLAMQSLGTCFDDGVGCRANRRRCNHWLWRASLQHSAGAIEMLNDRALLPLETKSNIDVLDHALSLLSPGQPMSAGGPNLAALLMAFSEVVQRENYSLPPFAGTIATATVNNSVVPSNGRLRTPLIGASQIKDLIEKAEYFNQRGNRVTFQYLRRGAAKGATSQTHAAASRGVDNQIFVAPPAAACDERVSNEHLQEWRDQCIQLLYNGGNQCIHYVLCVHNEKKNKRGFCADCEQDAIERLDAISTGSVVLSLDEDLPQRGEAAIFRGRNGSLKHETWKYYAGGEAQCVLAILAASGLSQYVSPIFIAQDPNFLWPLIFDHGSIRAALEFVAPHVDWNERVGIAEENLQERVPVIPSCRPGRYLRKCGNSFCHNFEDFKCKTFLECSRCERRRYCSAECQRSDWTLHKHECGANASTNKTDPRLDLDDQEEIKEMKYQLSLEQGQDCVVHSLQAKPQYNGMVGVVGETTRDGRIAVALRSRSETVLSIKPSNLHCIGVFCRKRRKKSRVFECVHGLEVCGDCYVDFTTINRLAKLKYEGQDMTSISAINQVNDTYFSNFDLIETTAERQRVDSNWPLECQGMESYPKQRFILRALLQVKSIMSINAEVAKTAFITYGGAFTAPILRANTRLKDVAKLL